MRAAEAVKSGMHETVVSVSDVSDGNHFTISPDFANEGIPYYRGQDVVGNFFIEQAAPHHITQEAYDRSYMTRSHLMKGDVLLSIIGTIGELSLVASEEPATCSCKLAILRPRSIAPEFLAVALRSTVGRLQIERLTRGAVQMGLILEDMDQLHVPRFSPDFENLIVKLVQRSKLLREHSSQMLSQAAHQLAECFGATDSLLEAPLTNIRNVRDLQDAGRWDSQFHLPHIDEYLAKLADTIELRSIGSLGDVTNGTPVKYDEEGRVPIIRSGDLDDLDSDQRFLRAADGQTIFQIKRGDVLISSIGFGSIGKVQVFDKPGTYGTVSEVTVIRQSRLDPYFLAAFLRSGPGQVQIERWITGATGQLHLYPRDVKRIMVPMADEATQKSMRQAAEDARRAKLSASALLEAAKRAVEIAVESDEAAALLFLGEAEG